LIENDRYSLFSLAESLLRASGAGLCRLFGLSDFLEVKNPLYKVYKELLVETSNIYSLKEFLTAR
jgi:hypothetical protein